MARDDSRVARAPPARFAADDRRERPASLRGPAGGRSVRRRDREAAGRGPEPGLERLHVRVEESVGILLPRYDPAVSELLKATLVFEASRLPVVVTPPARSPSNHRQPVTAGDAPSEPPFPWGSRCLAGETKTRP
jgi:hypothetical protein